MALAVYECDRCGEREELDDEDFTEEGVEELKGDWLSAHLPRGGSGTMGGTVWRNVPSGV